MTPQNPKLKSYHRQPAQIKNGLIRFIHQFNNRATKEESTIHFGDKTGIKSQDQISKEFVPKGETTMLENSDTRFGVNMFSTITNNGSMRFMLFKGSMNAERFVIFLR
jgi:hypothetical protein